MRTLAFCLLLLAFTLSPRPETTAKSWAHITTSATTARSSLRSFDNRLPSLVLTFKNDVPLTQVLSMSDVRYADDRHKF